jgi:serine protease inhibitor
LLAAQITEKGTEAAAATAAVQFYLGPMFTVTFDRPFFLFIYDALNKVASNIGPNLGPRW